MRRGSLSPGGPVPTAKRIGTPSRRSRSRVHHVGLAPLQTLRQNRFCRPRYDEGRQPSTEISVCRQGCADLARNQVGAQFGQTVGGSRHSHAAGTERHASPGRADPDETPETGHLRLRSEKRCAMIAQVARSMSGPCPGMWENQYDINVLAKRSPALP